MKSWIFIDKAEDKFYICLLIKKMGIISIFLNIKSILKRSRGGDYVNIPYSELISSLCCKY
jgi:hypothetical protein